MHRLATQTPLQYTGVHQIDRVQLFSKLPQSQPKKAWGKGRFIANLAGYGRAGLKSSSNHKAAFQFPNLLPIKPSRNITGLHSLRQSILG